MMSFAAIVLIASVIIFALIGVPLVWSLVLASVCSIAVGGTLNALPILAQRMFAGGLQYSMLAIFFFVLAGAIMQYGGLSRRLVAFANSLVGHISGGASLVCVMACAFFAAISGSAVATTAAIGGIMYPELKRLGYPGGLRSSITSCSRSVRRHHSAERSFHYLRKHYQCISGKTSYGRDCSGRDGRIVYVHHLLRAGEKTALSEKRRLCSEGCLDYI